MRVAPLFVHIYRSVALNAGFLAWDVVSIGAGLVSFGTATVAMQGAKVGARALLKAGVKVASRELAQKVAQLTAKALLAKQALAKAMLKAASTRVCVIACFPAGTPVATQAGQKPIEDIVAGELVWSRHEQTGELALKPVVTTLERETDHLVHLQLGGERIATTVEHRSVGPPLLGSASRLGQGGHSDASGLSRQVIRCCGPREPPCR